jgi:hypothetical protein
LPPLGNGNAVATSAATNDDHRTGLIDDIRLVQLWFCGCLRGLGRVLGALRFVARRAAQRGMA